MGHKQAETSCVNEAETGGNFTKTKLKLLKIKLVYDEKKTLKIRK